jgi:WD40 repeat protein
LIEDPEEKFGYEAQIREFGQTPKKLFSENHPIKGMKVRLNKKT